MTTVKELILALLDCDKDATVEIRERAGLGGIYNELVVVSQNKKELGTLL